jgi:hypothetical protein
MKKYLIICSTALAVLGIASTDAAAQSRRYTSYEGGTRVEQKVKKQGMSRKAQGAVIGGVTGGAVGYAIGRDVQSAAIGAASGAGLGYIYGRHRDRTRPDYRPTVVKTKRVYPGGSGYYR